MSLTYGFYNSIGKDRAYNAIQMSQLFDGLINDGVFASIGTSFVVTPGSNGMAVNVGIGRAWFNHTWTYNDSVLPVTIDASELTLNRIDAVVIEVNSATRINSIKTVKGSPTTNPEKPTLVNTATIHQHPIAYVYVGAGVSGILAKNLTNTVGTSECPYVTGIIQSITIDGTTNLLKAEFEEWFATIQGKLSGDVAGNLQNEIDATNLSVTKLDDKTTTSIETLTTKVNAQTANTGLVKSSSGLISPYVSIGKIFKYIRPIICGHAIINSDGSNTYGNGKCSLTPNFKYLIYGSSQFMEVYDACSEKSIPPLICRIILGAGTSLVLRGLKVSNDRVIALLSDSVNSKAVVYLLSNDGMLTEISEYTTPTFDLVLGSDGEQIQAPIRKDTNVMFFALAKKTGSRTGYAFYNFMYTISTNTFTQKGVHSTTDYANTYSVAGFFRELYSGYVYKYVTWYQASFSDSYISFGNYTNDTAAQSNYPSVIGDAIQIPSTPSDFLISGALSHDYYYYAYQPNVVYKGTYGVDSSMSICLNHGGPNSDLVYGHPISSSDSTRLAKLSFYSGSLLNPYNGDGFLLSSSNGFAEEDERLGSNPFYWTPRFTHDSYVLNAVAVPALYGHSIVPIVTGGCFFGDLIEVGGAKL